MDKKKVSQKESTALEKKCALICAEVDRLYESIKRGEEFSYDGWKCAGDTTATVTGIHHQIVTIRADLLLLEKMVRRVSPW